MEAELTLSETRMNELAKTISSLYTESHWFKGQSNDLGSRQPVLSSDLLGAEQPIAQISTN